MVSRLPLLLSRKRTILTYLSLLNFSQIGFSLTGTTCTASVAVVITPAPAPGRGPVIVTDDGTISSYASSAAGIAAAAAAKIAAFAGKIQAATPSVADAANFLEGIITSMIAALASESKNALAAVSALFFYNSALSTLY